MVILGPTGMVGLPTIKIKYYTNCIEMHLIAFKIH